MFAHAMPKPALETNRSKIIRRLEHEGWVNRGGGSHDVFTHPRKPGRVVVPRHRELTRGVARVIAQVAGW